MKTLVVYSSKTGNTRKLADAVFEALPGEKTL
jgi:flavodoxin